MAPSKTTAYRYPSELVILVITAISVILVIILTASATFCLGFLFILIGLVIAFLTNRTCHQKLVQQAHPVNSKTEPELTRLTQGVMARLRPGPIELFIAPVNALNAYTFGLSNPKVVVLYSALFNEMDEDEIQFILGHELGHVSLGHTWLNTLLGGMAGGMAGIPAPIGPAILLTGAFLWWNRACEYSADRAGLLACGKLNKATSALVKLQAGPGKVHNSADLQRILQLIEQEDDNSVNILGESLATHPMIIRRITALRHYATTQDYQHLQSWVNQ
jgi:Zn-dependent protease with chaperone function